MGILTRFKDIMASNINAVIDKTKNPEKTINEYMASLKADLGSVKSELDTLEVEADRAAKELNECESEIEKYTRYAEKAAAAGNSADARLYEQKKDSLQPEYERLKKKYDETRQGSNDLAQMREKLMRDIEESEARLAAIKSKVEEASRLEEANRQEASGKKTTTSQDEAFGRLEDRVNAQLDRAKAEAELNRVITDDELDELSRKYDESSIE